MDIDDWDTDTLDIIDEASRDSHNVRSHTPSPARPDSAEDRQSATSRRRSRVENSKRGDPTKGLRFKSKKELDLLYPPNSREKIDVLYDWSIHLSIKERRRKAPYCFKSCDGQPNRFFREAFEEYEAREAQRSSAGSGPESTDSRVSRAAPAAPGQQAMTPDSSEPSTPRSQSSEPDQPWGSSRNNTSVRVPKWKGKKAQPTDSSGRIRVLEERCEYMENALKRSIDQVVKGQGRAVDARMQRYIIPLRKEQKRLCNEMGRQIQGHTDVIDRQLKSLTDMITNDTARRRMRSPESL